MNEELIETSTDNVVSSEGFWRQPPSMIRARLQSPPPDHILDAIASQPYRGGFEPARDLPRPISAKIVQGSIPKDLVGTLAINSAGRIRIGARMLGHWFDGDGYITTLSFDGKNNEAKSFARYVRTDRFKAQEEQDKKDNASDDVNYETPLAFSGAWTKAGTGKWYENAGKIPQNPANTAVMWLPPLDPTTNPRLFAICEGGNPIQLDPITLDVIGKEESFTSANGKETSSSYFSAHFSQDPNTQHFFNHGFVLDPLGSTTAINLMELTEDGSLLKQQMSEMPYNTFIHDATMSQNHYMYFACPYIVPQGMVEMGPFVMGMEAMGEMMTWKGDASSSIDQDETPMKSYLQIHSKDDLNLKWRIEMPDPVSVYHIVDAYEEVQMAGELHMKVRIAELNSDKPADRKKLEEQFSNQYAVPSGERLYAKLTEYTFAMQDDGYGEGKMISSKELGPSACEYPVTNQNGKDERLQYTWINTLDDKSRDWFDAVQKVDLVNGDKSSPIASFGEDAHAGPPFFIPKGNLAGNDTTQQYEEDEGYIAVVLYKSDEHRSDVVILDSSTLDLLCSMELDFHVPYSFHGDFQPGLV